MPAKGKNGLRVVGIIFLLLGLFKFLGGNPWVVWIILGGLAMAVSKADALKTGSDASE